MVSAMHTGLMEVIKLNTLVVFLLWFRNKFLQDESDIDTTMLTYANYSIKKQKDYSEQYHTGIKLYVSVLVN